MITSHSIEKVHLDDMCVLDTLKLHLPSVSKLTKKLLNYFQPSNKRSSSGEMKIGLKRVGLYGGDRLDTLEDQR